MAQKYTLKRTSSTDYRLERPDGTTVLTTTFAEKPDVSADLSRDLVNYASNNGQSGIVDVLDLVLTGVRYIDAR